MSILLGSSWAKWLGPELARLKRRAGDGAPGGFDYSELLAAFKQTAKDVLAPRLEPYLFLPES